MFYWYLIKFIKCFLEFCILQKGHIGHHGLCSVSGIPIENTWTTFSETLRMFACRRSNALQCTATLLSIVFFYSGSYLSCGCVWLYFGEAGQWAFQKSEFSRVWMKSLQCVIDSAEGFSCNHRREGGLAGELLNLWNIWRSYLGLVALLLGVLGRDKITSLCSPSILIWVIAGRRCFASCQSPGKVSPLLIAVLCSGNAVVSVSYAMRRVVML